MAGHGYRQRTGKTYIPRIVDLQVERGLGSAGAVAQIDADREPAFMAVISGTGMSFTDTNGVVTFPHLALGF
mgnify:CR=1 FL=1